MRDFKVAAAFGIGLLTASGATLAQSYGRGRNVQFVDGATISPTSVQASGTQDQFMCTATTAVCEVESNITAATMSTTVPAFDIGPNATPDANDRMTCFSFGPSGSKTRRTCIDAEGDILPSSNSQNLGGPNRWNLYTAAIYDNADVRISFATNAAASSNAYTDASFALTTGSVAHIFNTKNSYPTGNKLMSVRNAGVERFFIEDDGDIGASGSFNSSTASGSQAYTCTNVGCRLSLGNTGRYLVDDGARLSTPAAFAASVITKDDFNNLILAGRRENSASSVGIIVRNEFALTTAGSKLVSFRNPTTTEIASIDKDGIYTGNSIVTTATGSGTKAMQIESGTVICLDGSACTRSLRGDAAESSLGSVRFYGSAIFQGFIDAVSSLRLRNIGITIADSGGAGAAAYTQSTYPSAVKYTCNDADGCDITMSEVGIIDGLTIRFTNESANTVNFTDTAGVTELAGNFAMGQWDTLVLQYNTDRWVEVSRSNN